MYFVCIYNICICRLECCLYPHHVHKLRDCQAEFHPHGAIKLLDWPHPLLVVVEEVFEQLVFCPGVGGQLGASCGETQTRLQSDLHSVTIKDGARGEDGQRKTQRQREREGWMEIYKQRSNYLASTTTTCSAGKQWPVSCVPCPWHLVNSTINLLTNLQQMASVILAAQSQQRQSDLPYLLLSVQDQQLSRIELMIWSNPWNLGMYKIGLHV